MSENTDFVLKKKSASPLMRSLNLFDRSGEFIASYWTTLILPFRQPIIYTPSCYDNDSDWGIAEWIERHRLTIEHEQVHIAQAKRYSLPLFYVMYFGLSPLLTLAAMIATIFCASNMWLYLWLVTIALLPLSIGFAWGRWRIEREAYLIQLRAGVMKPDDIVERLHDGYVRPWPRKWMRKWFELHAYPKQV